LEDLKNLLVNNKFEIMESFTWGHPFYRIYYKLIEKKKPEKLMDDKNLLWKKIVSEVFYQIFKIDDFFKTKKGRKNVVVARKMLKPN